MYYWLKKKSVLVTFSHCSLHQPVRITGPRCLHSAPWAPASTRTSMWKSLSASSAPSPSCTTSGCVSSCNSYYVLLCEFPAFLLQHQCQNVTWLIKEFGWCGGRGRWYCRCDWSETTLTLQSPPVSTVSGSWFMPVRTSSTVCTKTLTLYC